MPSNVILMPLFGQILLTFIMWVVMYKTRIGEMKAKKIHPQKLVDKTKAKELLINVAGPADNFNNLFEIPVLFYVLTIVIYITQSADNFFLGLLSAFVISRYLHSYIQATHNTVMQRFKVYSVGTILIWIGWAVLGFKLFV